MDANTPLTDAQRAHAQRIVTSLLLAFAVFAGVLLMREGVHFDNTVEGGRLFTIALSAGAITGFAVWTRHTGITPALSFSGPMIQLWLATLLVALVAAAAACFINRTFATLTDQWKVAPLDSIQEGRGARWHLVVTAPDGGRERHFISEQTAVQLKDAAAVRMRYARGALGFDYIAAFEPAKP